MFYPKRKKWTGLGASGSAQPKFTIQLTANYEPITAAVTATTVRFPVLKKPTDAVRPTFGIAKRKSWRQDNWSQGWGQFRFADKNRFWYATMHSFRDNELSAGASLVNPSTNISAAGVTGFCEYAPSPLGPELLTNTTWDADTTGWTAAGSTLASVVGGQSGNCLQVTNASTSYGYGRQLFATTPGVRYRVQVYEKDGTTTGVLRVGTTVGGYELLNESVTNANWTLVTKYFTAITATTSILVGNATNVVTKTSLWDEISVKYAFGDTGSSRTLYGCAGNIVYSYNHTTEVWTAVDLAGSIIEAREEGGVMYVTSLGLEFHTLTGTTWAAAAYKGEHFCFHDGVTYKSGDSMDTKGHLLNYGASWAKEIVVGGTEDTINAVISFKGGLYVLKGDGLHTVFTKPADATITTFTPKAVPIQTFPSQRSATLGKAWAIWGDRLWFNCGTSLAYFDGLDVVMVEYPWSVSPKPLSTIYSMTAMDDCLIVGFAGYALAYYDKGAGTPGTWHYCANLNLDTRQVNAVWFSRIPATNRLWFGLNDIADDANNSKYQTMENGLFMPSVFANTATGIPSQSVYYSSWFDDSDQTISKWVMEAYVEVDNCDATGNNVTLQYAVDGGSSYTTIGAAITADGITKLPTSGYVGGATLVAFRSIQLKAIIASATGAVSPIIKAIELLFQPRSPDRRQMDMSLLCQAEWEVGAYNAAYSAKQYRDFLWAASQQDTPITLTDEYGDAYTVSLVIVEHPEYTEDGAVTGSVIPVHLEEV
jgi:hypothetical protein